MIADQQALTDNARDPEKKFVGVWQKLPLTT